MNEKTMGRFQILSGNGLKMIAIITMLIDHIGAMIIEPGILKLQQMGDYSMIYRSEYLTMWWNIDMVLRSIGRIAFPIFCFLLVEGFRHTRDVKKYALRMLVFCAVSEIPFDLAVWDTWFYPQYQNVYFTLLLGLLALAGIEKYRTSLIKQAFVMAGCCGAAMLLRTDYGAFGVFFIVLLYLLRYDTVMQTIMGCIASFWEKTAPLAFIPIRMYNGRRGTWNLKYIFYAFYPAHILLLWIIRVVFVA